MVKRLFVCFLIILSCSFNLLGHADQNIYASNGIAIKGMDTVAYFTTSKAIKGSKEFSYKREDAIWYFESEEHMNLFIANPEKYAPAYGGWCAFGVTEMGMLHASDPRFDWTIEQGRLFLQANGVGSRWRGTADEIAAGDEIFKRIGMGKRPNQAAPTQEVSTDDDSYASEGSSR